MWRGWNTYDVCYPVPLSFSHGFFRLVIPSYLAFYFAGKAFVESFERAFDGGTVSHLFPDAFNQIFILAGRPAFRFCFFAFGCRPTLGQKKRFEGKRTAHQPPKIFAIWVKLEDITPCCKEDQHFFSHGLDSRIGCYAAFRHWIASGAQVHRACLG